MDIKQSNILNKEVLILSLVVKPLGKRAHLHGAIYMFYLKELVKIAKKFLALWQHLHCKKHVLQGIILGPQLKEQEVGSLCRGLGTFPLHTWLFYLVPMSSWPKLLLYYMFCHSKCLIIGELC